MEAGKYMGKARKRRNAGREEEVEEERRGYRELQEKGEEERRDVKKWRKRRKVIKCIK